MFRILFLFFLAVIGVIGYCWYSAQSLPHWYEAEANQQNKVVEKLVDNIQKQGVMAYLGSKAENLLKGELVLSENEFNALLQASLESSEDGRRLLQISDAVNAQIRDDQMEIGAIINLEKVATLDARNRERVAQVIEALPMLNQSRIYLAVRGKPTARQGGISVAKDLSIKLGAIPISSGLLQQFGVSVNDVSKQVLALKHLTVRSITLRDQQVAMSVLPRL